MRSSLVGLLLVLIANVADAAITFQGTAATGVDTASVGTYQAWTITPGGSGAASGDLCVLDASLDGKGTSAWPTISVTGGQTWNTLLQSETSTYARARYWTVFNGTWTGGTISITSNNSPSGAFAITGLLTCFHPTSGAYTWSVDVSTSHGEYTTPGGSCDVTVTGQTPTASASVVTLVNWMAHGNDTWALQTGGWTNPNSVTQIRNSYAGAHLSLSQAYKIQSSASATGNVTNRQSACIDGWTAITTFKETMGGGGGTGFTNRFVGFFGGAFARNLGGSGGAAPTAIKFQPGWYGGYNVTCFIGRAGCDSTSLVAEVNAEICPNANLVGFKLSVSPAFLIPDTATSGNYTGSSTAGGFTVIDAVLAALQACGSGPKFLILEAQSGVFGGFGTPNVYVPSFTYPPVGCGLYTCVGGTATGSEYGVVPNTQASQPGFTVQLWKDEWRNLAISAVQAYCARYDTNSSFYAISLVYYNTSLPFAFPYTNGYDEATFHSQMYLYQNAARTACPTTNVPQIEDYVDSYPSRMTTDIQHLQTVHGSVTNNDISLTAMSNGQAVYSGASGGTDYRGIVRFIEAFEGPCYNTSITPANILDVIQNGNASVRPRWSSHIVVWMDDSCNGTGAGWSDWKTFLASGPVSGKVMNGRDSTLRTPASVKSSWCETSMTCP